MADIFISYASEDRPKAQQLAQVLEGKGWSVFWDRTMLPGEQYEVVIEERLKTAKCVVVLWSAASVSSAWVRDEAREGLERGILVPSIIEEEVRPPMGFRGYQTADLSLWSGEGHYPELENLLRAVERFVGAPKPTAAPSRKAPGGTDLSTILENPVDVIRRGAKQQRITVHPDHPDILIDNQTGLMWTRKDNGRAINWQDAREYADQLRLGGYSDWRLPTIDELDGIYDPGNRTGTYNYGGNDYPIRTVELFQLTSAWIWSSNRQGPKDARYFGFYAGGNDPFPVRESTHKRALCVRSSGK